MRKAVLVLKMPESCEDCPLNPSGCGELHKSTNWCPLKPLPEFAHDNDYMYVKGFNDCLRQIME